MEAYTKTKVTKSQNAILYMKPCTKSNVKIITKKYATRSRKNMPGCHGQEMKCHYVNELLCSLKQTVQYEEVPAVFTVQKCHTAIERVCDTIYDTVLTE